MNFFERTCGRLRLHISRSLLIEDVDGVCGAVLARSKRARPLAGHNGVAHFDCANDLRFFDPSLPLLTTEGAIAIGVHGCLDPDLLTALAPFASLLELFVSGDLPRRAVIHGAAFHFEILFEVLYHHLLVLRVQHCVRLLMPGDFEIVDREVASINVIARLLALCPCH